MRSIIQLITTILAVAAAVSAVSADTGELELSVTYRERIALPPDAQVEVQLLDVSRADGVATRIASQRYLMTGVPMTIVLTYDPQIIDDGARYAAVADIWSGDDRLFRTTRRYAVLQGNTGDALEMVLTMVAEDGPEAQSPLPIAGVQWVVTEISGEPWSNDDPATLIIDADMTFGVFGGCNRFGGQVTISGAELAFPDNFAGTLMACPPEVEAMERRFLAALGGVSRYARDGATLVLTDAEGRALLRFAERPE